MVVLFIYIILCPLLSDFQLTSTTLTLTQLTVYHEEANRGPEATS